MQQAHGFPSEHVELSSAKATRVAVYLTLGALWFVGMVVAASATELAVPAALVAALVWIVGPGRALVPPLAKWLKRKTPGSVQTWQGSLVVKAGSSQQMVSGHAILEARLEPLADKLELRLDSGKQVSVQVPSEALAKEVLGAVGVGEQRQTHVARLGPESAGSAMAWSLSGAITLVFSAMLLLGGAGAEVAIVMAPMVATALFHLIKRLESPAAIDVAWNGITVRRPGGQTFHSHGGLRDVRVNPEQLVLVTDDGNEITAPIKGLDDRSRERIQGWVQARRQAFTSMSAGTDAFAVLDRRGRSLQAWREALSGVLQQEGQYRRAPITLEDIAGLLVNPHTPAERRMAAAFILSTNRSVASVKQIRFAAESSSSQPMRIALRGLAEEKIEAAAIEEALAAETGSLAR